MKTLEPLRETAPRKTAPRETTPRLRDPRESEGDPLRSAAGPTDLEDADAREVIRWSLERWHPRIAVCTAFQAEGMVILDMARRIRPDLRVITLDTGRLPPESYELIEQVRERYGLAVEIFFPDPGEVEEMVRAAGPNLFYRSVEERKLCCRVRKARVLERALDGIDAWFTGLRRDQTPERADTPKVDQDPAYPDKVKLAPLADWTEEQVWSYIREHDVPYHPLYDRGYTSIGCAPCTRAPRQGEGPRAGRWWWEEEGAKECGIHFAQGPDGPQLVQLGGGAVGGGHD